jgi:phosphotransferase system enzyme I (PtsP)
MIRLSAEATNVLDVLRRIVQEVGGARDLEQALVIIVKRVKQAMAADVCSVYLSDYNQHRHVLMATDGLNPAAVGHVSLAMGDGVVSVVAETAEPLNLDNAPDHPRYRFVAETGEEYYHGFLGVPIIHHRRVLGVLVVRQRQSRKFAEDEVAFLVTMAAQLAGAIAHAEASGGISPAQNTNASVAVGGILDGLAGAPGVGIGIALVMYPPADLDAVPDRKPANVEAEILTLKAAVATVQGEIQTLGERVGAHLRAEERALFDAYSLMLNSETLLNALVGRIRAGNWASGSLRETINEQARVFEQMDEPYLRERAQDIRDLGRRILVCLQSAGRRSPPPYPSQTVLVGDEITATMLAEVPREKLVAVVSASGSRSSHVAILARALGVPAVVGATDLPAGRLEGHSLIVDGYRGRVYLDPSEAVRNEYVRLAREEAVLVAGLEGLKDLPAETPDGVRIPLYANSGLISDVAPSLTSGAEGIGLYRTEFPFMIRDRFPGEEEQRRIYRQVLESYAPRPVVLRTLDVGGDKPLSYFPIAEDNPFLGWRGIRITLDHPEIFLVQLRAMLRASAGLNNLRLLFPMISQMAEVDEARLLTERAYQELRAAGEDIVMPPLGVMVEVPSAVYQSEGIARRVDYLSIGTNDLTQYLLAVDRNNARVASLYDALHPAVLRAIHQVIEAGHRQGKPVGVCGEMAGDPVAAIVLLGMGVDNLSMSVASLPRVKWAIRNISRDRAKAVVAEVLEMDDADTVREHVEKLLESVGLGGLVHAGK